MDEVQCKTKLFYCFDVIFFEVEVVFLMVHKPRCPHCLIPLTAVTHPPFLNGYKCFSCHGEVFSHYQLKNVIEASTLTKIWIDSAESTQLSMYLCSHCLKPMKILNHLESGVEVDVCRRCHVLWLDAGEREQLPARRQTALTESEEYRDSLKKLEEYRGQGDEWRQEITGLQYVMMILGLPIEIDKGHLKRAPELTWVFLMVSVVISLLAFGNPSLMQTLAYHGSDGFFKNIFNSFTVFFVHANLWHLVGNMYFLYLFGDNVENELGLKKYFLLVFWSTVVGTLSYTLFFSDTGSILVGASGGISGLMAFYLLRFPQSRFAMAVFFYPFSIPAWMLGLFFAMKELMGLMLQTAKATNVSHVSHLGGALVGVFFYYWYFKDFQKENTDFYKYEKRPEKQGFPATKSTS